MSTTPTRQFKYALFGPDERPIPSTALCETHFQDNDLLALGFAEHPDNVGYRQVTRDPEIACRVCGYVGP